MKKVVKFSCPHCNTRYTLASGSNITKCVFCGKQTGRALDAAAEAITPGVKSMAKKRAKKSGGVAVAGTGDSADQTYLDGVEPERSKTVEAAIRKMEAAVDDCKISKEKLEQAREGIIRSFEDTGIRQYRSGAVIYFLEDGGICVKRRKAKEK